jgi:hypothetical protein
VGAEQPVEYPGHVKYLSIVDYFLWAQFVIHQNNYNSNIIELFTEPKKIKQV